MNIRPAEAEFFHADRPTDMTEVMVALAMLCDMPNESRYEQIKDASVPAQCVLQCTEFTMVNAVSYTLAVHS
jgi:hypothetical protein